MSIKALLTTKEALLSLLSFLTRLSPSQPEFQTVPLGNKVPVSKLLFIDLVENQSV